MRVSKSSLRSICTVAALALVWRIGLEARAVGPFPPANAIKPGDVIFDDFYHGWLKLDPSTIEVTSLPWIGDSGVSTASFAFDIDGAVLRLVPGTSDGSIQRIHPLTGQATRFGPTSLPGSTDFIVQPDGDLLIVDAATSASKIGDVWAVTENGGVYRYSRQTGAVSLGVRPEHFSPHSIVTGPNGETYIYDFFRGLQQRNLLNGNLSDAGGVIDGGTFELAVFPNGDLAALSRISGLHRIDPTTGDDMPLTVGLESGGRGLAVDDEGDVWLTHGNGVYSINGITGARTLVVAGDRLFSPGAIAVVPANWTPPPVPEPATCALATMGLLALIAARRSAW